MKNKIALALAATLLSAAPSFASRPDAHNNGLCSARAIVCDELDDDETSEFVRGNANLYVGESNGSDDVGFSVFGNNIQTITWNQKGTGSFETASFFFFTNGNLILQSGVPNEGLSFTVANNGSINWRFDKLATSIPRNAQIREVYIVDFENGAFTDVSTGLKANSLTPGTLKGVEVACFGF